MLGAAIAVAGCGTLARNPVPADAAPTATIPHLPDGQGATEGREDIFVIHNGQVRPAAQPTRRNVMGIATRVLDASSRSAVIGALFRIYAIAVSEGADFHWVTIPEGVTIAGEETFDSVAMRALYDVGFQSAVGGARWATRPPGLVVELTP